MKVTQLWKVALKHLVNLLICFWKPPTLLQLRNVTRCMMHDVWYLILDALYSIYTQFSMPLQKIRGFPTPKRMSKNTTSGMSYHSRRLQRSVSMGGGRERERKRVVHRPSSSLLEFSVVHHPLSSFYLAATALNQGLFVFF